MGMIYRRKWKKKDGTVVEGKTLWIKYYDCNGKPIRESTKSTKDADAKRLLKRREGEISQGKPPGVYFDRVTFDELAEGYLSDYRINGKVVRDAKRYVNHLEPIFGGMRVTSITTDRIQRYINERLDVGAANGTINRELSALKRMLNLVAQQSPPKVDRVPFIPILKENNVRKGFFEHPQYLAVRAQLPEHLQLPESFSRWSRYYELALCHRKTRTVCDRWPPL